MPDTSTTNIQSVKLGLTWEQLMAVLNGNFSEIQQQLESTAGAEALITAHNQATDAHADLFKATVKSVAYNQETGVFTFTYGDDTTKTFDTAIEKVVANFALNEAKDGLVLTLADGTTQEVSLAKFIDTYAGSTTTDTTVTIGEGKAIQVAINAKAITAAMLSDALAATINGKVDKVEGKGLSTNDYTDAEKEKLAGVAENANNYVLPVAGTALGGVKNGGNVVIAADGSASVGRQVSFTTTEGWTDGANGYKVLTLAETGIPTKVYKAEAEGRYVEVLVGVARTATSILITSSEPFAGYVQVI